MDLFDEIQRVSIEESYNVSSSAEKRKKFGQFFTPEPIATLMAEWVSQNQPKYVLDPSVGTGVLTKAVIEKTKNAQYDVFDIDNEVLSVFRETIPKTVNIKIFNADYLTSTQNTQYDAIVMNPPYLKHQNIDYKEWLYDELSYRAKVSISKTSNAYILFSIKAIIALQELGRAAIIIPTEWMNSNFGVSFKAFLKKTGYLRNIVYFSDSSSIFDGALTTACVLLLEKSDYRDEFSAFHVNAKEGLPRKLKDLQSISVATKVNCTTLCEKVKWSNVLFKAESAKISGFTSLGNLGTSKRGIATGANKYFHLNKTEAQSISRHHKKPCVGKSVDVGGYVFSGKDYSTLKSKGKRCYLIDFKGALSHQDKLYIKHGEKIGVNDGYILSRRKPWYSMEQRQTAPIWASVFGRNGMRFIYNEAGACNLTTFHGFYPFNRKPHFLRALVFCLNSKVIFDMAQSNIRTYGDGLLKFEPKDILDIKVPDLRLVSWRTIYKLSESLELNLSPDEISEMIHHTANEATDRSSLADKTTFPPVGTTYAS